MGKNVQDTVIITPLFGFLFWELSSNRSHRFDVRILSVSYSANITSK